MSRIPIVLAPLCAIGALAGCAPAPDMQNFIDERAPAARVTGEPLDCLQLTQIRDSNVHSNYTIDFETIGGDVYRNTLPNSCPGLGFEKSFSYSTSLSKLCSTDIITVFDTGPGGGSRASCGLGQFVPVELAN